MKIIDAQVHIWSQTVTPPSGLHRKVQKFTAEECLKEMDEAGVDAALIHPPYSWDPTSNQLALDAARKYPDRFAVMGQFPLDDPESRKRIHGWRNQPGMMGLRWALLYPDQQKALHEGKLDWVWPAAEKEGIPVATMAGLFLPTFRKIAEAHPRLYAVEGLLAHEGRTSDDETIVAQVRALVDAAVHQGRIAESAHDAGQARLDVHAQALRAGTLLVALGAAPPIDRTALDTMADALAVRVATSGGLPFSAATTTSELNVWTAMFAEQALAWADLQPRAAARRTRWLV